MSNKKTRHLGGGSLVSNISSEYLSAANALHRTDRITVYVEGYEDVAFWRNIFDLYQHQGCRFEIMTPSRSDMAKGKKVVLGFAAAAGPRLLLCVDSDFDYLFGEKHSPAARIIAGNKYIFQTYVYAIENYMCCPRALSTLAVRATKNDAFIFDFEDFMTEYSKTIYPLFMWYAYAAMVNEPDIFALSDFRNAVRLGYLNVNDNGSETLAWLSRQVNKRLNFLTSRHPAYIDGVKALEADFAAKGVTPQTTYLYMQGHTLMENVVKVVLDSVCEELRKMAVGRIMNSSREGLSLRNELSYYNNSLRETDALLRENTLFMTCCTEFDRLRVDMDAVLTRQTVAQQQIADVK